MANQIQIFDQFSPFLPSIFLRKLRFRVSLLCKKYKVKKKIEISFVPDKKIRALNKKFRSLDKITDVLSFEMLDDKILGDIIISKEQAQLQAKRYKVKFENEIKRLVIHGFLHLIKFDHKRKSDREKMRKEEKKCRANF